MRLILHCIHVAFLQNKNPFINYELILIGLQTNH